MVRLAASNSETPRPRMKGLSFRYAVLALCSLLAAGFSAGVPAQPTARGADPAYPVRVIRMIVPFPPGGGFDGISRPYTEKLSGLLGQPVIIENRPGAGGNIGAQLVARAAPDGYTLLLANPFLTSNPAIDKASGYDPVKDFAPITRIGSVSNVIAVHPSVPAKDLKELIALSKKRPLNYGTPGVGTATHLICEMLNLDGTINLVHVPYKGSGPAIADTLGGQIDMVVTPVSNVTQHIRAGKLRGIAVMGSKRAAVMPELPTFIEAGIPLQAETWYGVFAPAGTPAPVLKRLYEASLQVMAQPEVLDRLHKAGYDTGTSTPEQLGETLRTELERWVRVVNEAKLRKE
jgi:tripartite-type tricarboxylate transporter receptor subunit TctC